MKKIIASKIKEAREERDLTQKQVATVLGLKSGNAISEIERGNVQITAADLYLLADLFNKPLSFFYGEDFGDKEVEDLVGIVSQLNSDEREQLKRLAVSIKNMKMKLAETEENPSDEKKREMLEDLYYFIIEQMMPISRQLVKANELKDEIEIELGMKESAK